MREIKLTENSIKSVLAEILKIKKNIYIDETGYDINNLDSDCEFLILRHVKVPLTNLPINLKEIYLYEPQIDIIRHKISFGCKVYVDNILQN